jgi:hypothetical protein
MVTLNKEWLFFILIPITPFMLALPFAFKARFTTSVGYMTPFILNRYQRTDNGEHKGIWKEEFMAGF